MKLLVFFVLLPLVFGAAITRGAPIDQFIHFTAPGGIKVLNAALGVPIVTNNVTTCALACLDNHSCVSFSFSNTSTGTCELNQYSMRYALQEGAEANGFEYYLRIIEQYDDPANPKVTYNLQVPTQDVFLSRGVFSTVLQNALEYLSVIPVDDMLYFYRIRANINNPPGQCWGWDQSLRGSISGLFMMGAGNALRWVSNSTLANSLEQLVDGIKEYQMADGYAMAYAPNETMDHENPDYVLSWVTHGLIEADIAGIPTALKIIRDHLSWFNYNQYLPQFMPPDTLITDVPPMYGASSGHQIYLIYQGIIHNTRMANSRLGLKRDVDVVATLYQENEWLVQLINRNLSGIWQKQWFPHNYEVTAFEAYLDMYVLTGNTTYLDAVNGAWEMFMEHWIHVGGSMAINEGSPQFYYPPSSFYLECTYSGEAAPRIDPPPCAGPSAHMHTHESIEQPMDSCHATGETCGSSFWIRLNQRFHRLFPDVEKYVTEIERELYNVIIANQAGGFGNRYFANLHKFKQQPSNVGTCCEGQGVRTWGSMPEFIYSFSEYGIYMDLYADSSIKWSFKNVPITINMVTEFPYNNSITIKIYPQKPVPFELAIRIPSWTNNTQRIMLNGQFYGLGNSGNYTKITRTWETGDVVEINLEMVFRVTKYVGLTQIGAFSRYAFEYGPILLAATGPWDNSTDCIVLKGLEPQDPSSWMEPVPGQPLHFNVVGYPGYLFMPYMEIGSQQFTVYPIIA